MTSTQGKFDHKRQINRTRRLIKLNIKYLKHIEYQIEKTALERRTAGQMQIAKQLCSSMEQMYHKLEEMQYYLNLQKPASSRSRL